MGIKEKLQAKLGRPPTAAEIEEGRQKRDAKKQTAAPSSSAPPAKSATPNMLLVGKKDGKKDGKRKVEEMASSAEPPAKRSAPAAPPHTPAPGSDSKPKKPSTPYNLFMKAELVRVKAANPGMAQKARRGPDTPRPALASPSL